MKADTNLFKGKVILVYLIDPPSEYVAGLAISNPKTIEYLGRYFVVGKVPESISDWTSGLRISVAFDQVAHFMEFKDENDFFERAGPDIYGLGNKSMQ